MMRCQFSFFPSIVHLGVTKEIDSLFMYGPEEAHRDFFNPSYIPTFMEGYYPITSKMKSGMKKRALKTCDHSFQCIFDIAITGRFGIGQATKEFQEWLMGMKRDLHDEGETNASMKSNSCFLFLLFELSITSYEEGKVFNLNTPFVQSHRKYV